jgi:alpha-L-rhamnosidase
LSIYDLRCEYLKNPIGIDIRKPRLSWKIQSGDIMLQTSYQILVADSPELLQPNKANIWDSGKITSDQSIQVEFDGKRWKPHKLLMES